MVSYLRANLGVRFTDSDVPSRRYFEIYQKVLIKIWMDFVKQSYYQYNSKSLGYFISIVTQFKFI